jgi:hypothetical protein
VVLADLDRHRPVLAGLAAMAALVRRHGERDGREDQQRARGDEGCLQPPPWTS